MSTTTDPLAAAPRLARETEFAALGIALVLLLGCTEGSWRELITGWTAATASTVAPRSGHGVTAMPQELPALHAGPAAPRSLPKHARPRRTI